MAFGISHFGIIRKNEAEQPPLHSWQIGAESNDTSVQRKINLTVLVMEVFLWKTYHLMQWEIIEIFPKPCLKQEETEHAPEKVF